MAETIFRLTTDEWVLVKPGGAQGTIIGDTLIVPAGTDIDSIVISWGDTVAHHQRMQALGIASKTIGAF